mmetsp:Transcript_18899/g.24559  ORF Transcript_18899/g.24559 Transcript_18899/m.24559 type:complete len:411 (+) Transcript_18899:149-1381(+)|eukprot:CAMPEP_0116075952 /NCGR_PEP_ID=MMETSP0322-20121206/16954_1 /TAXON_ID=163516 /ORGANISM="Leptocylindrus danicus var. apora, Strain B651" /LENGTH=410 /DNA_ID=CAMNT_0003566135 /DNA_START=52 /DNA_END=1284 /DNA_ORIENTATION=-
MGSRSPSRKKRTAQRRIESAKKGHRPSFSLHDWSKEFLYGMFEDYKKGLSDFHTFTTEFTSEDPRDSVVREIEYDEFIKLDMLTEPSLIRDIPLREGWSAIENWPKLLDPKTAKVHKFRNCKFKCGEDDDGHKIKIRLKYFSSYIEKNRDDSPLYIFDSTFDSDKVCKSILNDYKVPSLFRKDLFTLVSESRRPPYRWWLLGPERSGTTLHIDPLATAAWNTLIKGKKRWVLFPPETSKRVAKASSFRYRGEDDEASQYFMTMLRRLRRDAKKYPDKYPGLKIYEFTQNEGETVFIPNGWWHAVLNLTDTVGITQNFVSEQVGNFDAAWLKTRTGRKKMACKWYLQLEDKYPHLAKRAMELNRRDNFKMKYDPDSYREKEKQSRDRTSNGSRRNSKRARKEEDRKNADSP